MELIFLTTNNRKFSEMKALLPPDIVLKRVEPTFNEIQGTPREIIDDKVLQAYNQVHSPVIVDDTNLTFEAWKYLPGAYINDFMQTVGHDGLFSMLREFPDKRARAEAFIGYHDGASSYVFHGEIHGQIVAPRGTVSFGWDPIFQPDGHDQTFAEMGEEGKNKISHRKIAVEKFLHHLALVRNR
jgi:inosine triphosphate pyrophosphatase